MRRLMGIGLPQGAPWSPWIGMWKEMRSSWGSVNWLAKGYMFFMFTALSLLGIVLLLLLLAMLYFVMTGKNSIL